MAQSLINKSMDRDDLLSEQGQRFVTELAEAMRAMRARRLPVTSWYGGLATRGAGFSTAAIRQLARRLLRGTRWVGGVERLNRGGDAYRPVPGISNDDRHPWFLYWEAFWVMTHGPRIGSGHRLLDAGGTASLFSSFLASRGAEVHSVDQNESLVAAGNAIAEGMDWNMTSHCMDMTKLDFEDGSFDHAYSICVFEHLDWQARQAALREIARVLKPGGHLSMTFDYGGPGVYLSGKGTDYDPRNLIRTPEDVGRHFLSSSDFEPLGNPRFFDNGKSYLVWPDDPSCRYTFGAVFLRKPG